MKRGLLIGIAFLVSFLSLLSIVIMSSFDGVCGQSPMPFMGSAGRPCSFLEFLLTDFGKRFLFYLTLGFSAYGGILLFLIFFPAIAGLLIEKKKRVL